jgi:ribulose-phosphate 3-epimerase
MIQVIPAILARTEQEFTDQLARLRDFAPKVSIDIIDGKFAPDATWPQPENVRALLNRLPFEVHLMVENPEHLAPVWLAAGADRVVIHAESTERERMICRATQDACRKISLAINPKTPVSRVIPNLDIISHVTIMAVTPGQMGQPFQEIALEKISALKRHLPGITIAVDGGVSALNATRLIAAGAEHLVVGSAIMTAPDPHAAYDAIIKAAACGDSPKDCTTDIMPPADLSQ